jgi:multiple sugar transport system substrate-binding protein
MKKTFLFGAVCLCLLANLSLGCAPQATGPRPIQDKVTLTFVVPSNYQHLYDDQLAKFKLQEPNITVKVLSQGFGGSQPADVTLIGGYQFEQRPPQDNIAALDLSPLLQADITFKKEDYFPGALETFQKDGKQMALPTGIDPNVMFYNQDLFNSLGVALPKPDWTWEQFRQTAQQLTNVPKGIFGYRPSQRYLDSLFFVFQNGGALYDDQQNPKIDGPETIKAVEWYTSLFGPDGPAATDNQMLEAYGIGRGNVGIVTSKIGMWMGSVSSLTSDFDGMIKFKVGMAPLPRGPKGTTLAQFEGLMITTNTTNPQAAWRLVSFLAQQPNTWVYPARKSLADSSVFLSAFGKDQATGVRAAIENSTTVTGMDFRRYGIAMLSFSTAVRKSITEGIPAADALKKAQDDIQR